MLCLPILCFRLQVRPRGLPITPSSMGFLSPLLPFCCGQKYVALHSPPSFFFGCFWRGRVVFAFFINARISLDASRCFQIGGHSVRHRFSRSIGATAADRAHSSGCLPPFVAWLSFFSALCSRYFFCPAFSRSGCLRVRLCTSFPSFPLPFVPGEESAAAASACLEMKSLRQQSQFSKAATVPNKASEAWVFNSI